jgi:hypothetical protein
MGRGRVLVQTETVKWVRVVGLHELMTDNE